MVKYMEKYGDLWEIYGTYGDLLEKYGKYMVIYGYTT